MTVSPIKLSRIEKGLSQYDLAQLVGLSNVYISMIERGQMRCPVSLRYLLAKVLEKDVDQLFGKDY